jgi:hypothetical protein
MLATPLRASATSSALKVWLALAPPAPLGTAAALSDQESLKERKLGALHTALAWYQGRLGLDFQHGEADGEQLRVVLTAVDPRDPARPFAFAVQVAADSSYAGGCGGRLRGHSGVGHASFPCAQAMLALTAPG